MGLWDPKVCAQKMAPRTPSSSEFHILSNSRTSGEGGGVPSRLSEQAGLPGVRWGCSRGVCICGRRMAGGTSGCTYVVAF